MPSIVDENLALREAAILHCLLLSLRWGEIVPSAKLQRGFPYYGGWTLLAMPLTMLFLIVSAGCVAETEARPAKAPRAPTTPATASACPEPEPQPACPPTPSTPPPSTAKAVSWPPIKPYCSISYRVNQPGGGLMFLGSFRVNYTKGKDTPYTRTLVFRVQCVDSECIGVQLDVPEEVGKPLGIFQINAMSNFQVLARTDTSVMLKWGLWFTFHIDTIRKRVTYDEVGPSGEGHGETECAGFGE